jgi:hypothetical protein
MTKRTVLVAAFLTLILVMAVPPVSAGEDYVLPEEDYALYLQEEEPIEDGTKSDGDGDGMFMMTASITATYDAYKYSTLTDPSIGVAAGPTGYRLADGKERVIIYTSGVMSGAVARIYSVIIPPGADPNALPPAQRTFTLEKTFSLGTWPSNGASELHVDEVNNIIYFGASHGIKKFVYDASKQNYVYHSQVAPAAPLDGGYTSQSLACDPAANIWYAGARAVNTYPGMTKRKVWKYDGNQGPNGVWTLAFEYTTPEGPANNQHGGMEFVGGYLYLVDYDGNSANCYMKKYATDGALIDTYWHEFLGTHRKGLGFGALGHFWIGGWFGYGKWASEVGGGRLQEPVGGNEPPVAFDVSAVTDEDTAVEITLQASDVDGDPLTFTVLSGPSNGTLGPLAGNKVVYTPAADYYGADSFTFVANDGTVDSNTATVSITVNPVNDAPVAAAENSEVTVDEGQEAVNCGTWFDADGDDVTLSASVGTVTRLDDGTWVWSLDTGAKDCTAESQTVVIMVSDGTETVYITFDLTINNLPPDVGPITAPLDPVLVNTEIQVGAAFTDPGVNDTHTAVWDWGDGTASPGVVIEAYGSGTVSGAHTYTSAGVYTLKVTVTDNDGGSDESVFYYIVAYDPGAGFVTGGGWINSPVGAFTANPALTGKANFGFVSKYQKGANVPTGQTQFQFKVANLNFHSEIYEWLVVAGAKAQYKGAGAINGAGNYGFILTAIDGQVSGGGGLDKFRIKIWDKNNGDAVVYDNQLGESDTADPVTALGGGSIVIHK